MDGPRLAGGEAWWRAILERIRGCDVFVVALSQNIIESTSCQAELQYAQALGLPILPVQVGPVDSTALNPLATVQAIDYRRPTPDTGMRLVGALRRERARLQPLPSPLPDEPPVVCNLAERAEREPVPQGATIEGTHGARPGAARGAVDEAEHQRGPGPTRKRRRLVSTPVVTGVLAVIGAVVLAVVLAGCRGPSGGQASTASSPSAAPSTSEQGPTGQGPYTVAATVPVEGGAFGLAVDPSTHTVYVANADNTVSVIDGATRTVTATVPVGKGPVDLAVDASTHTVYVANADNTVSVIDGTTRTVTATVPVGKGPVDLAVDPGTHTVYVTTGRRCANAGFCYGDGTVSVIDGATRTVAGAVSLEGDTTGLAVDPDTHTVYVSTLGGVSVIDGATRTVTATVPVEGPHPGNLAVDPATHTVYVTAGDGVSVIDGATRTVTATVPLHVANAYPYDLAVDPGTHTVYVTYDYNDTMSVIDGGTRTVTATVPFPSGKETLHMLAVDRGTHTVYVTSPVYGTNQGNGTVLVIERR